MVVVMVVVVSYTVIESHILSLYFRDGCVLGEEYLFDYSALNGFLIKNNKKQLQINYKNLCWWSVQI